MSLSKLAQIKADLNLKREAYLNDTLTDLNLNLTPSWGNFGKLKKKDPRAPLLGDGKVLKGGQSALSSFLLLLSVMLFKCCVFFTIFQHFYSDR